MNIKKHNGFTLIELMIVVVIIAILGSIAYPGYLEYVRRAHRGDARVALLQAQLWLERVATATGVYPTLPSCSQILPDNLTWKNDKEKRYDIKLATCSDSGFKLEAVPRSGPQKADKCGTLTLTHSGERNILNSKDGVTKESCWGG